VETLRPGSLWEIRQFRLKVIIEIQVYFLRFTIIVPPHSRFNQLLSYGILFSRNSQLLDSLVLFCFKPSS
jgi:hypothetical protein